MYSCSADFFKSEIEMVKSDEMFAVAADFDCSEFEETVVEAVFENCKIAAQELTWENEEKVLEKVYSPKTKNLPTF